MFVGDFQAVSACDEAGSLCDARTGILISILEGGRDGRRDACTQNTHTRWPSVLREHVARPVLRALAAAVARMRKQARTRVRF